MGVAAMLAKKAPPPAALEADEPAPDAETPADDGEERRAAGESIAGDVLAAVKSGSRKALYDALCELFDYHQG